MTEIHHPAITERYDKMFKTDPERAALLLAKERYEFGLILDDALTTCNYTPPKEPITILNVGCGMGVETPVLIEQFGGSQNKANQVSIIGIDPLERRIQIAQELAENSPGKHTFIVGDARKLDEYPNIPEQVDVALIRRQNIGMFPSPAPWVKIFSQTMERLRPGGLAVVTSLHDSEHDRMLHGFKELGYAPAQTVPSYTRYRGSSTDSFSENVTMPIEEHIAIFHKPIS